MNLYDEGGGGGQMFKSDSSKIIQAVVQMRRKALKQNIHLVKPICHQVELHQRDKAY